MIHTVKILFSSLLCFSVITPVSAAIYVENLPSTVTESEITVLFSQYGKVMKVNLSKNDNTELPEGSGFVHMGNFAMEKEAIAALHGEEVDGQKIKVSRAKPRLQEHGVLLP